MQPSLQPFGPGRLSLSKVRPPRHGQPRPLPQPATPVNSDILRKPFGALAITTLITAGGTARSSRHLVNLGFALVTPLGVLLFDLGAGGWAHAHRTCLGGALAFCAGTFLCIASADLIPELQFHRHDRLKAIAGAAVGSGSRRGDYTLRTPWARASADVLRRRIPQRRPSR